MKLYIKEQVEAFLKDLSKLSRKHKIFIGGCECCGSPFLMPISKDGKYEVEYDKSGFAEKLKWKFE
jgi:hypothetical protein